MAKSLVKKYLTAASRRRLIIFQSGKLNFTPFSAQGFRFIILCNNAACRSIIKSCMECARTWFSSQNKRKKADTI